MLYDITYIWNLKYNTNEPMYETETDSQTQRTYLWLPREGVWLGWIGRLVLVNKTIMYRMDKQKGPTVQHRELYSISCDNP